MHILDHVKHTVVLMGKLLGAVGKLRIISEIDMSKIEKKDIDALVKVYEELSAHLFDYREK